MNYLIKKGPLFLACMLTSLQINAQSFVPQPQHEFPNVWQSCVGGGDYNNGGFLDIMMTGMEQNNPISRIYKNNGDNPRRGELIIDIYTETGSKISKGGLTKDRDHFLLPFDLANLGPGIYILKLVIDEY